VPRSCLADVMLIYTSYAKTYGLSVTHTTSNRIISTSALPLSQVFPSSFTYSLSEAGEVVVSTPRDLFTAANLKKFDCPWEKKVNTAFFRGTATGKTPHAAWVRILRIADAYVALL
jgi:hypothetical protein